MLHLNNFLLDVLLLFIPTLALRCYQGLGSMASELRMKLMISMKEVEEDTSRQKEEVNIVLKVSLKKLKPTYQLI